MEGHAQWRYPDWGAFWGAIYAPAVEGVDAAIPASIAGDRNRILEQALMEEWGKLHGGLTRKASQRGLSDWEKSRAPQPFNGGAPSKYTFDARWALT